MNERAAFLCDTSGQTLIIYIRGEIDHHTAVSVRNGIDTLLFEKRPSKLILDLSEVGFMDSSGLGLIMGRLSVMKSLGGDMLLRNPGRETQMILSLAGMERLIPTEYSDTQSLPVNQHYAHPHMAAESVADRAPKSASRRRSKAKASGTSA
ncbi:MAG: STAS domain-containing protein [Ruminococcaceae bacterium]|nr:STAS domain-containing protein [Oscillospiraceae bacterium]